MVVPTVTALEFDNDGFHYDMYRQSDGRWVLFRREESNPNIPPFKEVFTETGWENVIKAGNLGKRSFRFDGVHDVCNYFGW